MNDRLGPPSDGSAAFGPLLQRHRIAVGLSQEELAERAGLSRRGISDLERGTRRAPYPATVRRLAEALSLNEAERTSLHVAARSRGTAQDSATTQSSAPSPALATVGSLPADGAPPPHNLPASLSSFVGREQEVAAVQRLVATHRLVTLTGPGGVGKTRLALAVAGMLVRADFEDGVFLVDLAPLRDPNLVMSSVAQILHVQESGRPLLDLLTVYLRDRRTLLLIDNFEQVVAGAAGITTLLERCPRLAVLATSRTPLRLQGEHT